MTTKNKYGQHNKRKNARAKNIKKATSGKPTLQLVSPERRMTLLEQIQQAEAVGADSVIDLTEDDRVCVLRKNPETGKWENDFDTLNAIKESIEAQLGL